MSNKELFASEIPCSARPIIYNGDLCIGCNKCAVACQSDVLVPSTEKGEHPIIMYPGECIYCGSCVMDCPIKGAIKLQHPLLNRTKFVPVRKAQEEKRG
ncbi:MAG TPA: 4Fe-4S dicluster domain-containing protein [Clostridia bacterium]|nr:4Fe-4S dicluster domain-containing protein [Clostridia bacterium]